MTFACPHFDPKQDYCLLLKTDCVPGRAGCVLRHTSTFAIPAEERVQLKEEEKQRAKLDELYGPLGGSTDD